MEIFLVGGAVRDELLGLTVKERDWVVIRATPEEMIAAGFRQVGNDFPVFIHPVSGEEYALARTERKTAPGYRGFVTDFSPDVTLEEDLRRRDLTINAMARDKAGQLIDPYEGQSDLEARILRHVSPAFVEDPVRVLRVARLAARLRPLGFQIAAETGALMRRMVANGEIDHLVAERVWQETYRALSEDRAEVYFEVLRDCGALAVLFPEIEALFGVPQPSTWHPEVDTGVHTLMVLAAATRLSPEPRVRFAALVHDLGKGETPREVWPSHRGHEQRSVELVRRLCTRLKTPNDIRDLAVCVAEFHGHVQRAEALRPGTLLRVIEAASGLRDRKRFEEFLLACEADARGRTGLEDAPFPQGEILRRARDAAAAVRAGDLHLENVSGAQIGERLRQARRAAIAAALATD
jgi:tRNA nucleotidyltransferase (CCA-adding enzyme)